MQINRLLQALGDSVARPRYLETIIGVAIGSTIKAGRLGM
jgi:hypothetical protein